MNKKELLELALWTEGLSVSIAFLALIGHTYTTSISSEFGKLFSELREAIIYIAITYIYGALILIWLVRGMPTWQMPFWPHLTADTLIFIMLGATINSFCLARMVDISGGVNGLFTPLFLLIPFTTSVLLSNTDYWWYVPVVFFLTLALYFVVYMRGKIKRQSQSCVVGLTVYGPFWCSALL